MITIKEEFVGGAKWTRAVKLGGADAIQLWLALKAYAAAHLTDGFIPDEELDTLPGAPAKPRKVLPALVDCGALERDGTRGAGLVDHAEHGWQLHDYEDHANSSTEEELRKEKARERKRRWRAEQERLLAEMREGRSKRDTERDSPAGHDGTTDGTVPRDTTGQQTGQSPGPRAQAGAPPRVHTRARNPTQPNPTQPSLLEPEREGAERPAASAAPLAKHCPRRWRRVPPDWQPKPEHIGLAMQIGADLQTEVVKFRDHEFRDPKSDADACFRTWLRRSIELRRSALPGHGAPRAGDALQERMARTSALLELERTEPQRKALPS